MPTINQLSALSSLSAGDSIPVYAASQGDARRASFTTLTEYLSDAFSTLTVSSYVKTEAVTVANLPDAATAGAGARAMVTDANSTTFNAAAAGGGANIVPVFSTGSAWRIG